MDRKPLIMLSIGAMVLLVLASLGNVMGYQSVKSTVNDSPLFQTRTQRATNQQQNGITSQYLGKGIVWDIPKSDNRNQRMKESLEYISKMDDKTFERFSERCIQRIQQDKSLKDTNPNEIVKYLKIARTNAKISINPIINRNTQLFSASGLITICHWYLGCIPEFILGLILYLMLLIGLTSDCMVSYNQLCHS